MNSPPNPAQLHVVLATEMNESIWLRSEQTRIVVFSDVDPDVHGRVTL